MKELEQGDGVERCVWGKRLWKMSALHEKKEAVMHTVGGKSIAGKGER